MTYTKEVSRAMARVYRERGKLTPQPCARCGDTLNMEMHHTDYQKPLDVKWLCRRCHKRLHGRMTRTLNLMFHVERA
jgi:ribosomal protein S27AE